MDTVSLKLIFCFALSYYSHSWLLRWTFHGKHQWSNQKLCFANHNLILITNHNYL